MLGDSNRDPFDLFSHSYNRQIEEISRNISLVEPESIRKAVQIILDCRGKLVLTGMGKSGLIAQKLAATFSSTGTPAFFLHPGESLHGDLGVVQSTDVIMVLAKSGESDEVVQMMQVLRKMGNPIISLLGKSNSSAGRMSDVIIRAEVSREADPLNLAPTASTTVSLIVGDSIAATVSELRGFRPEHFALYHPAGQLGKRLLLNVEDLLHKTNGNPVVHQNAQMRELLDIETKANLGGVIVVDDSGCMVGIVTDGDIRRAIIRCGNVLDCSIDSIMTKNPIHVFVGDRAIKALELMENRPSQISVIPVVTADLKAVGLLRIHDLVRAGL